MIEDVELLRRYAAERSQDAFAELVRRRVNLVYSVALRQVGGDTHLAQDVTQRVFADLARKAKTLCGRTVLSGWLYRSAQFAATDVVRSERRRRTRETETHLMNQTNLDAGPAADWDKFRALLDETMAELGNADRDAVALRFFEQRSFADIALALRSSEEAARKRVTRALDQLYVALARRGIKSTAAALGLVLGDQVATAVPAGFAAIVVEGVFSGTAVATATVGLGFLGSLILNKIILLGAAVLVLFGVGWKVYEARDSRHASPTPLNLSAKPDDPPRIQNEARTERESPASLPPSRLQSFPSREMTNASPTTTPAAASTDYRLRSGDTLVIAVQNQPDFSTTQTVSRAGGIRLVMFNRDVPIAGKTVREAEHLIEDLYRDQKVLRAPVVSVTVIKYSPSEITVLGEVRSPGRIMVPSGVGSLDLVEVLTKAGGLTPGARKVILVTHRDPDGKEVTRHVDLNSSMPRRSLEDKVAPEAVVFPGDRVFVPVEIF